MSKDLQQTDGCVTVGTGVAVRRTAVVVRRTVVATVAASHSGSHSLRSKDCRPHNQGQLEILRTVQAG